MNVEFRQALIAPTKYDGRPWDGLGSVDPTSARLVAQALGASNPYAAVLGVLANPALAALEKPEPFGQVRVFSSGMVTTVLPLEIAARDTTTPIWKPTVAVHVPLSPSSRIEVELWDKDISEHDPMGAGTVTYQDLVAALQAGTLYHVRLAEQTQNQVLFFDVSVYPTTN
ncbi:MAG TPA: C2 domain-containing protein [Polyangiaceae bacterium]